MHLNGYSLDLGAGAGSIGRVKADFECLSFHGATAAFGLYQRTKPGFYFLK